MKPIKLPGFFLEKKFILLVYVVTTIVATLVKYYGTPKFIEGIEYTNYNNYVIYKQSFLHLIAHVDLYLPYPENHFDYFKYSPTFAVLMCPIAYLPDWLGVNIWNLINTLVIFFALSNLKLPAANLNRWLLWIALPELVISLQNCQSNALIAGLIICAYNFLEGKNFIAASALIAVTFFIKVFGLAAILLCLFYSNRWKSILSALGATVILALLPLVFVSYSELMHLYKSWVFLLAVDQYASYGLSVYGWLQNWFDATPPKNFVVLFSFVLLCLPLINFKSYKAIRYRLLFLSSLLIWIVIFNHKADSSSYIIALCGATIWYLLKARTKTETVLFIVTLIFSSLSPTDIFPEYLRQHIVIPYSLKVVPYLVIWVKILIEQLATQYYDEHSLSA